MPVELKKGIEALEVASQAATPAAGKRLLYPKSDGWYEKNSAGVETKISGGGGGTPANMVTTDTVQTITATKTLSGASNTQGLTLVNPTDADAVTQIQTPPFIRFYHKYWNGSGSVQGNVTLQVSRADPSSQTRFSVSNAGIAGETFNPSGIGDAVSQSRYVGATTSGAPTSGTFSVGDFVIARNGKIWICTSGGTPGTWVDAGSGSAPANMVTTDTTQTIAGAKTFSHLNGVTSANGFFDNGQRVWSPANPPDAFTVFENPAANIDQPPANQVKIFSEDGVSISVQNSAGVSTKISAPPANPPQTLDVTESSAASVATPPAGEAALFTEDGTSLKMRNDTGAVVTIGPVAGATPAWAGNLHAAMGNGDPEWEWQLAHGWGAGTTAITPTNVTATVARVWVYAPEYSITVNRLRWFAVAGTAAASNFRFAIYNAMTGAQVLAPQTLTFTGANRWTSHAIAALALSAGTKYFCALSATATATTWSMKASGIPATYPPPESSPSMVPPNLRASNGFSRTWFGQLTVAAGALPATMSFTGVGGSSSPAQGSAWAGGGVPFMFFDNENTA